MCLINIIHSDLYYTFIYKNSSSYNKMNTRQEFLKAKLKKSDDHTNIDKYRVAANITEYFFVSKLIFHRIIQDY